MVRQKPIQREDEGTRGGETKVKPFDWSEQPIMGLPAVDLF